MKIDLHIHTKDCSDGKLDIASVFKEARQRHIRIISITDHDAITCQETAKGLAEEYDMGYIPGVELNIGFSHPEYGHGKSISLDLLGYQFDIKNRPLLQKLEALRDYRKKRAEKILHRINQELLKTGLPSFTPEDMRAIEDTVDGAFGRPHIANYMVKKELVSDKQEAFDRYLVRCNVPKMHVSLEEASELIRGAGGKIVLAHPGTPQGTSLMTLTPSLDEHLHIIREHMFPFLDGLECWHPGHDVQTATRYFHFTQKENLLATGGSDCHQQPIIMGTVAVPEFVKEQFGM
jgi:predicted metal-dependent phosphoesterase TrpH